MAEEQKGGHWLVLHLGELVALAYQVSVVCGALLDSALCDDSNTIAFIFSIDVVWWV